MIFLLRGAVVGRSWLIGLVVLGLVGGRSALAQRPGGDPDAERFFAEIAQRKDKGLRQQRLGELLERLKDPQATPGVQASALRVLLRVGDIPFDRTPFLPVVKALLSNPAEVVRSAALAALPNVGAGEADLPAIARLADDPAAPVRASVVGSLEFTAKGKGEAVIFPVVEKLLADPVKEVKIETLHHLWGCPVSPKAEEQIIALSQESMVGGPSALGYDAVYYALSTRPVVSVPVARRLIELMQDPKLDRNVSSRATWGLTHHQVVPEATDMVVRAIIAELDETLDPGIRRYLVYGLNHHRTPAAETKLREIAEKGEK